jgi:hypothetical protein
VRIYYCGHVEGDVVSRLANVGKKNKTCGNTAYNRCDCGEAHPDTSKPVHDQKIADHPEFLCEEHLEIYAT